MSEHIQEPKKTQTEEQQEQDSDGSSRSPGVTDRGLIEAREPSKSTEIKGSTQKNQSESSSTEKQD
jgi:hypothetical protein